MEISIREINIDDLEYPRILREIPDPPKKLYVMGDISVLENLAVAIVGTRKPTDYGVRATGQLARDLARNVVIVSGLAYGVDTVALNEALTMGGKVAAVIGSGLDKENFYPAVNYALAVRIATNGGVVISEYPTGTPPLKHHFPARNRIIAGLAQVVVVTEAGEGSGALITADFATDFGREVWAVAGSIFVSQTIGSNKLIQDGAGMTTSAADILNVLGFNETKSPKQIVMFGNEIEEQVVNLLNDEAMSIDEIVKTLQLDSAEVSSTLTLMEIKGMIKPTGAGKFIRS